NAPQCGAFGCLVVPVEKDELLGQVKRAVETTAFTLIGDDLTMNVVARSQLMQDRLTIANRAARCDEPIFLTGEEGTGKELLARAIHAASDRRGMPFVTVSCRDRAP